MICEQLMALCFTRIQATAKPTRSSKSVVNSTVYGEELRTHTHVQVYLARAISASKLIVAKSVASFVWTPFVFVWKLVLKWFESFVVDSGSCWINSDADFNLFFDPLCRIFQWHHQSKLVKNPTIVYSLKSANEFLMQFLIAKNWEFQAVVSTNDNYHWLC